MHIYSYRKALDGSIRAALLPRKNTVILISEVPRGVSISRDFPTGFSSPKNLPASSSETTQVNGSIKAEDGIGFLPDDVPDSNPKIVT